MGLAPQNPDLPTSWLVPGIYIALNLAGSGASLNDVSKRAVIVGYKKASGSKPSNSPVRTLGQSQANAYAGQGSDAARAFAAFQSQIGGGQADVWMLLLDEPSAGAAATALITILGTTAAAQDAVNFMICGYTGSVIIAPGDTPSIIATNLAAAINAIKDIPVTASPSSGVVTLTYNHKGQTGNDLPIVVEIPGSSGMLASPGTLTYATNAVGAGSATVTCGGTTYTAVINNSDTPTTVAAAVAAAINAGGGPLSAQAALGVVTLYYVPERAVRRISAAIVTSTGMTVTAAAGTAGTGTPTMTTALAVMAAQKAFPCWVSCFNDTATLGSIFSHILNYANGIYMKGQKLFVASADALAVAGAIPTGTTPTLTSDVRAHVGWCPDAPVQAYELAARHAARVCVENFKPKNYDGEQLKSITSTVPLPMPHVNSRPDPGTCNSALSSYYLSPYVVDASETLTIMRSRTCSNASDQRLWDTALVDTADWTRNDYLVALYQTFKGKSIKKSGVVRTPNTVSVQNIADFVVNRMFQHEDIDFLDGADELKKAVVDNINPISPTRADVYIPFRPPVPLHQIAPTVGLV